MKKGIRIIVVIIFLYFVFWLVKNFMRIGPKQTSTTTTSSTTTAPVTIPPQTPANK